MYQIPENVENNIFLIDETGNEIRYSDFQRLEKEFQKSIESRKIVLALSEPKAGFVMGLISFLTNGQIPLLVESSLNSEFIENLIDLYEVDYIFTPEGKIQNFMGYEKVVNFGDYSLLKKVTMSEIVPNVDLALLLSTSGTTGSPKVVRLSYENITSNGRAIAQSLSIGASDRAITTLPLSYSFGFSILNSHVVAGASMILTNSSITERSFWNSFSRFKPTSLSGVPFTFEMLQKMKFFDKPTSSSLRTITQAGGRMKNSLICNVDEFSRKNQIQFYVMYGQTEATARMSILDPMYTREKIGSIGKAILGGEFRIEYIDETHDKSTVKAGELIYSGPNVMMGYAENRFDLTKGDETNSILHTGDVATVDDDGFYFIVGRLKRFVKIAGKRINLDELENELNRAFSGVACMGEDESLIVFTSNADTSDLKRYICSKFNISPLKVRVDLMEEIPRLSNGKIDYKELKNTLND